MIGCIFSSIFIAGDMLSLLRNVFLAAPPFQKLLEQLLFFAIK